MTETNDRSNAIDSQSSGGGPSRRRFLGGVALAAVGATAGCVGGSTPPLEPRVPKKALRSDGWTLEETVDEQFTKQVSMAGVEQPIRVHTKAKVYGNRGPLATIRESFGVEVEDVEYPPAQFVAAKAETDPPVSRLLGVSDTALDTFVDRAEEQAKAELRKQGLENVRRVSEGELDIEAAGTALHRTYRADYPYGETTVTRNGREITVESGSFTVEAQLAVWPYDGLLATAGGAYPGEKEELTVSARGVTTDVSLDFRPETYRESVRKLTALVS